MTTCVSYVYAFAAIPAAADATFFKFFFPPYVVAPCFRSLFRWLLSRLLFSRGLF